MNREMWIVIVLICLLLSFFFFFFLFWIPFVWRWRTSERWGHWGDQEQLCAYDAGDDVSDWGQTVGRHVPARRTGRLHRSAQVRVLFVCLFVESIACLLVCPSVCLVCLVCLSVCLFVFLSLLLT
jgi:hypothetical protein